MPTWSEILKELSDQLEAGVSSPDPVRRKYLTSLAHHTSRPTILYATCFTQGRPDIPASVLSINDEDIQGFMEVSFGVKGPSLDLILHSPGGVLTAAEGIVRYLRSRFSDIRVIVPQLAMSAATMIACSANKVVMGKHSFLGPTDPQLILETKLGVRSVPAQAIIDQFAYAQKECADQSKLASWLPMLAQYGPDLLQQCRNASSLSRILVREWLEEFMFSGDDKAEEKAKKLSDWLCEHSEFMNHGRHITRAQLLEHGMVIEELESDQIFQDLVLSVFHATTLTFLRTSAVKIIENNAGRAFIKQIGSVMVQPQSAQPTPSKP